MYSRQHWLIKSEPSAYSIDDLKKEKVTAWTGVRNFQARNFIQSMRKGDSVLFYHSSCPVPGIYGLATVASAPYPDPTQFDPKSPYFDSRATEAKPLWQAIDLQYKKTLAQSLSLTLLHTISALSGMPLLQRGNRLSVFPVTENEWETLQRITQ